MSDVDPADDARPTYPGHGPGPDPGAGGVGQRVAQPGVKVGAGELQVTRGIGRVLNRTFARVTVTGGLPATGGVLLAVNHTALIDGPMLYGLLPRPVAFLVKAEVFRGPLAALLHHTQQIAVRRGVAERAPLLAALAFLRAGGLVGVFPEGTRGAGDVSQVQHGIAYLAVRSGAPVVPVAVHGTAARRGRAFFRPRRPPVLVAFGPPVRVPSGAASGRTVAAAAVEIHRILAAHVSDTRPHPEEEQS